MRPPIEKSSSYWVDADSEERHYTRESLNQLLLTAPVPGHILDVSGTGIGIETREPLVVLARNTFAWASDDVRFEFLGEVRWCRLTDTIPLRDGGSPVYRAGIAFVERQQAK